MTFMQLYAFFILPVILTTLGWCAVLVNDWHPRRKPPGRDPHG